MGCNEGEEGLSSVYLKWLPAWQQLPEGERAVCALVHIKGPGTPQSPGLLAFPITPCLERYLWGGILGLKLEERKPET